MSIMRDLSVVKRGLVNYVTKRPICVSFEVTYRCNARCKHCHLGGPLDEQSAPPERFGELCRSLKPVVAQISGGEPLLRGDLFEIVRELANPGGMPFVVITTNGALLKTEKYLALKEAGVDEFSVSLDFPDERHDDFRRIPGLFKKIETFLHDIRDVKRKGITLACVVQSRNFRDLIRLAEFARDNGVKISFSTYTWLRTNDKSWLLAECDLPEFREIVSRVLAFRGRYGGIITSKHVFRRMIQFFETQRSPNCRAGEKFLVVNPTGTLSPCGLIIRTFEDQRDVVENFLKTNTCEACNTSIRANTEKTWAVLLKDALDAR